MALWEIEHVPTATKRTHLAWGFAALDLDEVNWSRGNLVLPIRGGTSLTDPPMWAHLDHIRVWRDGVSIWHGWLVQPQGADNAQAEQQVYTFADAWYWLDQTPVRDPRGLKDFVYGDVTITTPDGLELPWHRATGVTWQTGTLAAPGTDIVWADWDAQSVATAQGQITRALYSSIWAGAPIAIGTIGITGAAPVQESRNSTCAAWIQSAARYSPLSVQWWDQSGTIPVFHCADRAGATVYSHALDDRRESMSIAPLWELQTKAVRITYHYTVKTEAGNEVEMSYLDKAGDDAAPEGPGTLCIDVDCSSKDDAMRSWYIHVAARLYSALSVLAWGGSVALHEGSASLPRYRPGHALNITGGNADWATMAALVQGVSHHVSAEANDTCEIKLGAPNHLGFQDWLELAALGRVSASSGSTTGEKAITPTDPSTYRDLMPEGLPSGPPSGGLQFQQRGGECTLYGFAEFGTPSATPRWYKTRAFSGTMNGQIWGTIQPGTQYNNTITVSGSESWSTPTAHSGAFQGLNHTEGIRSGTWETFSETTTITASSPEQDVIIPTVANYDLWSAWGGNFACEILSPTLRSYRMAVVDDGFGVWTRTGGPGLAYETLSSEDTEEDAYQRCLAVNPWPTYPAGHARAGEQMWGDAVSAIYTSRTTPTTFLRRGIRYRGTIGNLGVWMWHRLHVRLQRRPVHPTSYLPTGEWEDAGERVHMLQGDLAGSADVPVTELEAPRGYELAVKEWVTEIL